MKKKAQIAQFTTQTALLIQTATLQVQRYTLAATPAAGESLTMPQQCKQN